jgi:uncharacterized protein (DUF302 family)
MQYIEKSKKSVDEVIKSFEETVSKYKFGILHIHNITQTLNSKGVEFKRQCQVLDICNPNYANKFLSEDISLAIILPCKIAIYEEEGETTIAMNSVVQLVDDINPELIDFAKEVQDILLEIIDEVK